MVELRRWSDRLLDAAGALLIMVVVALMVATTWLGFQIHTVVDQHNHDLVTIKTLTEKTHSLSLQYLAEQGKLVAAGKEQAAFGAWLIEAQASICTATHATCPAIPSFAGVSTTP